MRGKTPVKRLCSGPGLRRAAGLALLWLARDPGQAKEGAYTATPPRSMPKLFINSGNGWAVLNVLFTLVLSEIVFMSQFLLPSKAQFCFSK
jgi:hypothetical protein